jgi:hypothetical protein
MHLELCESRTHHHTITDDVFHVERELCLSRILNCMSPGRTITPSLQVSERERERIFFITLKNKVCHIGVSSYAFVCHEENQCKAWSGLCEREGILNFCGPDSSLLPNHCTNNF